MSRSFFVDILMGGVARVKNLLDPVDPQDAATKAYVDANGGGISTFTEAVTNDPGTDITVVETETLTDGSNADLLHQHSELHTPDSTKKIVQVNDDSSIDFGENAEITIQPGTNQRITFKDIDSANVGSLIINDSETVITTDNNNDPSIPNSTIKLRASGVDLLSVSGDNVKLHAFPDTRDDGKVPHTARSLYVDADGIVKVGEPRSSFITNAGRVYGYTNNRWISIHDDLYGGNYFQFTENAGTDANPTYEWEHNGIPLPPGAFVKSLTLMGRTNSINYTDLEISIVHVTPTVANSYSGDIDGDGEVQVNEIYRGFYSDMITNLTGNTITGNTNDKHMGRADIDFTIPELGEVRMYIRPVGNLTAQRYFYGSWVWEIL